MTIYLISSVRIFDGESIIYSDGSVLLENGLIRAISPGAPSDLPPGCVEISGTGCTLLPGLIDAHVHARAEVDALAEALRYGVTTVLDLHNEVANANHLKKAAAERDDVADILSAYNSATIPGGWPEAMVKLIRTTEEVDYSFPHLILYKLLTPFEVERTLAAWPRVTDVDAAKRYVAENKAKGADFIKLMQESGETIAAISAEHALPTPGLPVQRAIVEAAHAHGLLAVAHAMNHRDTHIVLEAGVDGLAHSIVDRSPTPELLAAFQKSGAFLIPTLVVLSSSTGEEADSREHFARNLGKEDGEFMCSCLKIARESVSVDYAFEQVKALKAAGVDIVCGTDTAVGLKGTKFGLSLHHEMWLYVNRCDFSPIEALKSATSTSARRWRLSDRGLVKPGMKADLVLVKGDPTVDIECTRDVVGIWRNGVQLAM